ncbi:MAG: hypothetical protein JWQ35_733 [Bacteriovoracaceae bacterium]|nr:hypothetical protein [Bacteriovoracaceae bacterium]
MAAKIAFSVQEITKGCNTLSVRFSLPCSLRDLSVFKAMLRVLIWRLCFEVLSLLKAFGLKGKTSYYFAFGGNLDPSVLERRRISVASREIALLSDHEIKFNHEVPFEGVGFASVESKKGSEVPGMILEISKIDEWRMDYFEGCLIFNRYRKSRTQIGTKRVFYYFSGRPLEGLKPTTDYLKKILAGYRLFLNEDSTIIKKLLTVESVQNMIIKRPPRFLIINYNCLGSRFRSVLEWYDSQCMKLFVFFIFRPSVFQKWLPFSFPDADAELLKK